jgi:hypothetical protein
LHREYQKTYDYILLLDKAGSAICTYEDILPYVKNRGDGFTVSIPIHLLSFIAVVDSVKLTFVDVKDHLLETTNNLIEEIMKRA